MFERISACHKSKEIWRAHIAKMEKEIAKQHEK